MNLDLKDMEVAFSLVIWMREAWLVRYGREQLWSFDPTSTVHREILAYAVIPP
jgi:hypothetical protein